MKSSIKGLTVWLLLLAISVVVPAYVLLTGDVTLLPFVKFSAILVSAAGIFSLAGVATYYLLAVKLYSPQSDKNLRELSALLSGVKDWRKVFAAIRVTSFYFILLWIGETDFAVLVGIGYAASLIAIELVHIYVRERDKVDPLHIGEVLISQSSIAGARIQDSLDERLIDGLPVGEYIARTVKEAINREANPGGAIWSAQRRV